MCLIYRTGSILEFWGMGGESFNKSPVYVFYYPFNHSLLQKPNSLGFSSEGIDFFVASTVSPENLKPFGRKAAL